MSTIASGSQILSNVVKFEAWPEVAYTRKTLTVYDSAATWQPGAVLGRYIDTPVGTAAAVAGNTGNGTMGAVTMTSNANLVLGTYVVRIVKAAANAGQFLLLDPNGKGVGHGDVAVAFSQAGFAFTLADGSADFVVGDSFTIVVSGTEKYKLVEATATNGTEVARAIFVGDSMGTVGPLTITANTDTTVLAIVNGPATVNKSGLSYGTSVNTVAEIAAVYAQLAALNPPVFAVDSI